MSGDSPHGLRQIVIQFCRSLASDFLRSAYLCLLGGVVGGVLGLALAFFGELPMMMFGIIGAGLGVFVVLFFLSMSHGSFFD